jgi:hypothetical protein
VLHRLSAIVLALAVLVPAELVARFLESCRAQDACCCRSDDAAHAGLRPANPTPPARAERVDCCEAPCAVEHAATPGLATSRSHGVATLVQAGVLVAAEAELVDAAAFAPQLRTRGPPHRLHATLQRWLL